jgi:hypothetical protein
MKYRSEIVILWPKYYKEVECGWNVEEQLGCYLNVLGFQSVIKVNVLTQNK